MDSQLSQFFQTDSVQSADSQATQAGTFSQMGWADHCVLSDKFSRLTKNNDILIIVILYQSISIFLGLGSTQFNTNFSIFL